ncbi:MAG: DUF2139 domain-containing protein [Candidatus Nezhaarchaeales archaeon]
MPLPPQGYPLARPVISLYEKFYHRGVAYAPEYGEGGIYGLLFYKNRLFYTYALEAKFIVQKGGEIEKEYDFSEVGPAPRVGGDTYGAICPVDDKVYFGGWVHAPISYDASTRTVNFSNKYAHLHEIDVDSLETKLLWKETAGVSDAWTGEVSDIIYDPINDRLLVARGDGSYNLGVYAYDRATGQMTQLLTEGALRGVLYLDHAVFNTGGTSFSGFQVINLHDGSTSTLAFDSTNFKIADDGPTPSNAYMGSMIVLRNRVYAFIKGGMVIGDPTGVVKSELEWSYYGRFIRLFDNPSDKAIYAPWRHKALGVAGGALVAYTIFDRILYRDPAMFPTSILVFVDGQYARIVGALGRVTGLATDGRYVYIGTNTGDNDYYFRSALEGLGVKDIIAVPIEDLLFRPPPPLMIKLTISGVAAGNYYGGIPLLGYKEPKLFWYNASGAAYDIEIYEYDLQHNPADYGGPETVSVNAGKNTIDLSGYKGIISIKTPADDTGAKAWIVLE